MRVGDVLLGVAGADCGSMRALPQHERRKYVGIGAMLILTSLIAALSFGYATSAVVHDHQYSLLITIIGGLVWGAAILIIDRHLIISISSKPSWFTRFISVLVRVALATMVAGAVSIPVELMIFKDRLERELFETKQQLRGKDKTDLEHYYNIDDIKQEVKIQRSDLTDLKQQLDKLPPSLTTLDQQVKACRSAENTLRTRNTNKILPLRTDLNKAKREQSSVVRTLRNISKSKNWEYEKQLKQHINRLVIAQPP